MDVIGSVLLSPWGGALVAAGCLVAMLMMDLRGGRQRKQLLPPAGNAGVAACNPGLRLNGAPGRATVDGRVLNSADLIVTNTGDPFVLVTRARLQSVAGMEDVNARWEYHERRVLGGNGQSLYSVATVEITTTEGGKTWLVKVRDEGMKPLARWSGPGVLSFDTALEFYMAQESRLTLIGEADIRCTLSDDGKSFNVAVLKHVAMGAVKMVPKSGSIRELYT